MALISLDSFAFGHVDAGGFTTPMAVPFTVTTGGGLFALVNCQFDRIGSVSFLGDLFTQIGRDGPNTWNGETAVSSMWYLPFPIASVPSNVLVQLSSGPDTYISVLVVSFFNVQKTMPTIVTPLAMPHVNAASVTFPTLTPTATGSWALALWFNSSFPGTITGGSFSGTSNNSLFVSPTKGLAASYSAGDVPVSVGLSWTASAGGVSNWIGVMAVFAPFVAPVPPPEQQQVVHPTYEALLNGVWTDITDDVVNSDSGVKSSYGIQGSGPLDSVAGSGQCPFMMRNDSHAGRPLGYYSPGGVNCRPGWKLGVMFRRRFKYLGLIYTRFYGKVYYIKPDAGLNSRRQVQVVAYDVMRSLAETVLSDIDIQINKTESEVIANILAAVPAGSQPLVTDIDPGADIFPLALDDIGATTTALSAIADVARSSSALVAVKGDGTFIVRSRHTRTDGASIYAFNSDYLDIDVPTDLAAMYNYVEVTIHPKTPGDTDTTVLYAISGTVPSLAPGETRDFTGSYNDSANAQKLIGGKDFQPITAGTDYAGNTASDGSGTDVTGSISVVATPRGTTSKFSVTNSGSVAAYLVAPGSSDPLLQIRGRAIYDQGPQTYHSPAVIPDDPLRIAIDMPYQNDPAVAQDAANYIQSQYSVFINQAGVMTFMGNDTQAHMMVAMTVEPGDVIVISDPVTGLSSRVIVQSVAVQCNEGIVTCELTSAPANIFDFWKWGVTAHSEWGISTRYGY